MSDVVVQTAAGKAPQSCSSTLSGSSDRAIPKRLATPKDVAVDRQTRDAQGVAEHDIRRLATNARKVDEVLHPRRDHAGVAFRQRLRHAGERPGFGAEEAGRLNLRLEFGGRWSRQGPRIGIPAEERRRDLVNAFVGALRGENRGD